MRTWAGWHHHQTLSLLAAWFLTQEAMREKKWTPALTAPQVRFAIALLLHRSLNCDRPARITRTMTRRLRRNEQAKLYHWKSRNRLPPKRIRQPEKAIQ